jgi:hypothetical protein
VIYQILAVVFFIIAAVAIFIVIRLLSNKKWIKGFLQGSFGMLLVIAAVVLGLSGKDIFSYRTVENNQTIATLSFHKKTNNIYTVDLQETAGASFTTEIEGQQWQLNARMFHWTPLMAAMGFKPGYRLEGIAARFLELQMDNMILKRDIAKINTSGFIDLWSFFNQHPGALSSVDAYIGSPSFTPVADGAIFDVSVSGKTLVVNPMNDVAKSALKSW